MSQTKTTSRPKERGFILVLGMIIMAFLLLLAVPFLFQLSTENRMTKKSYKSVSALTLAEAGIERAIWELNYGDISSWAGDDTLRTMTINDFQTSGGTVIGDIVINVADPALDDVIVESTGSVALSPSNIVSKTVRVQLHRDNFQPFDFGLFGVTKSLIGPQSFANSCNTKTGQTNLKNCPMGSNSTASGAVKVDIWATLYGSAYCGEDGNPATAINNNGTITGTKSAMDESKVIISAPSPPTLPNKGALVVPDNSTITITEDAEYDSIFIGTKATLRIEGDRTIYVKGIFDVGGGNGYWSRMTIPSNGSAVVYLGGSLKTGAQCDINNTRDPEKLVFMTTESFTGDITIQTQTQCKAAIYAPNAKVTVQAQGGLKGALVANEATVTAQGGLYYDEALKDFKLPLPGAAQLQVQSWQQVANPGY